MAILGTSSEAGKRRHARAARGLCRICLFVFVVAALTEQGRGQVAAPEDQIKAAYMFNFAKFVEWPAEVLSGSGSMNFCALGLSRTADELDALVEGKSINGHPIKVRRMGKPEEIKDCHLIFVSGSAGKQQQILLKAAKGLPILLVGEAPGFVHSGGTIGFVMESGRVIFEVNPDLAEESHLKISSKLLSLARIVSPGSQRTGQ